MNQDQHPGTWRLQAKLEASEHRWSRLAAWLEDQIDAADSKTRENKQLVKLQVEAVAMRKVLRRMRG